MRILMLHNDYQQVGGEFFSVREEVEGLRQAGASVKLLLADNDQLRSGNTIDAARVLVDTRPAFDLVAASIREFRPDIIHAQNLFPRLGAGAIQAMEAAGVPWVRSLRNYRLRCIAGSCMLRGEKCGKCTSASRGIAGVVHGCYRESRLASLGAVAYARAEQRAERRYPPSQYVLLSEAMREVFGPQQLRAPASVKPNPIRPSLVAGYTPDNFDLDVLYVGRLSSEKNAGILTRLADLRPALNFGAIGTGPDEVQLRTASKHLSNLHWFGELGADQTAETIARSRCVIVPSNWEEPFGRVAAEALSAGTPPIVSNRGGLPEIVAGLPPSLVVQTQDDSGWLAAIDSVLTRNSQEERRLREACRIKWTVSYSSEVTTATLMSIYRDVLRPA